MRGDYLARVTVAVSACSRLLICKNSNVRIALAIYAECRPTMHATRGGRDGQIKISTALPRVRPRVDPRTSGEASRYRGGRDGATDTRPGSQNRVIYEI